MTDVFTKAKRSQVMAKILGRGNKATEVALIRIFRAQHITGWRRHTSLFGKPDFTFRGERVVVFVDGCFWHGCPLHCRLPSTNSSYWSRKITSNRVRDKMVNAKLRKAGWRVVRIWEHDLAKRPSACVGKILRSLHRHTAPVPASGMSCVRK